MRNSSIELFRIISTFLVLIVHFNGWFLDMPDEFSEFSTRTVSQSVIEALSCTCVNCFIIITGWFGLKFKWQHIWNIWSVLVSIYIPFYVVSCIYIREFSLIRFIFNFLAVFYENYYIQCYLMLIVLSPILNTFINKYGRKILPFTLFLWGIEIVFDWILDNNALGFGHGYMLTHFILLYLLARTAKLYCDELMNLLSAKMAVAIYVLGALSIASMYMFMHLKNSFAYTNPVNIIMSFSLFLIFARKTFNNKWINWISKSTLAVYIIHCTPPVLGFLRRLDNELYQSMNYGTYLLSVSLIILMVFISSIIYDKLRLLFMPVIGDKVCAYLNKKTSKYLLPE